MAKKQRAEKQTLVEANTIKTNNSNTLIKDSSSTAGADDALNDQSISIADLDWFFDIFCPDIASFGRSYQTVQSDGSSLVTNDLRDCSVSSSDNSMDPRKQRQRGDGVVRPETSRSEPICQATDVEVTPSSSVTLPLSSAHIQPSVSDTYSPLSFPAEWFEKSNELLLNDDDLLAYATQLAFGSSPSVDVPVSVSDRGTNSLSAYDANLTCDEKEQVDRISRMSRNSRGQQMSQPYYLDSPYSATTSAVGSSLQIASSSRSTDASQQQLQQQQQQQQQMTTTGQGGATRLGKKRSIEATSGSTSGDSDSDASNDDNDNDDDDSLSENDNSQDGKALLHQFAVKLMEQNSRGKPLNFWQYNSQARGPKGRRIYGEITLKDVHVLDEFTDPVGQTQTQLSKLRHGEGNDPHPNSLKLIEIGARIGRLEEEFKSLGTGAKKANREDVNRQKNKLASRICRLKKKAQHEANKVKLEGLREEHGKLVSVIAKLIVLLDYHLLKSRTTQTTSDLAMVHHQQNLCSQLEVLIQSHLKFMIAGHTAEYVNTQIKTAATGILDK